MELVSLENELEIEEASQGGRTKAVIFLSNKFNITTATFYRWLKSGDHFIVHNDGGTGCDSVFKLIKHVGV